MCSLSLRSVCGRATSVYTQLARPYFPGVFNNSGLTLKCVLWIKKKKRKPSNGPFHSAGLLHIRLVCLPLPLLAGALPLSLFLPLTVLLSVCPPRGANPLDHRDNSFSRSRSSSVTSIDKEAREAISSFHFSETYARKGDCTMTPCLHVGTSLGTVLALAIMMPPAGEQRQLQPVIISPTGGYPRKEETMQMRAL